MFAGILPGAFRSGKNLKTDFIKSIQDDFVLDFCQRVRFSVRLHFHHQRLQLYSVVEDDRAAADRPNVCEFDADRL